jgi:flavin reductase (DIM6/NTAB) family NADH-FMN oxidoreductase RutF
MTQALQPIEPRQFWTALSGRAVGAAVVTASTDGLPAGFLALSVTHLTANPPTLLVSIGASTSALATVRRAGHFAVNYLAQEDAALADVFGGKSPLKGADRFDPARWGTLATGAPVLHGAIGAVDCVVEELITRHETVIALGTVVAFRNREDGRPLVTFRGRYE